MVIHAEHLELKSVDIYICNELFFMTLFFISFSLLVWVGWIHIIEALFYGHVPFLLLTHIYQVILILIHMFFKMDYLTKLWSCGK